MFPPKLFSWDNFQCEIFPNENFPLISFKKKIEPKLSQHKYPTGIFNLVEPQKQPNTQPISFLAATMQQSAAITFILAEVARTTRGRRMTSGLFAVRATIQKHERTKQQKCNTIQKFTGSNASLSTHSAVIDMYQDIINKSETMSALRMEICVIEHALTEV